MSKNLVTARYPHRGFSSPLSLLLFSLIDIRSNLSHTRLPNLSRPAPEVVLVSLPCVLSLVSGTGWFSTAGWQDNVHFGSLGRLSGASGVFLSALKPPRRVLDSTHLDHTARQHLVDRNTPYSPVPVLNSSPPRWAEWHLDRSRSSKERIEASPKR